MSNQTKTFCPNCNAEIKSPMFGSENWLLEGLKPEFINKFTNNSNLNYCSQCSKGLIEQALQEYEKQRKTKIALKNNKSTRLMELLHNVPIVTLHNPQDWKYQSIEILSAQSVTGTGVITEIASSWTDFFGMESSRYNEKLKSGEERCKNILRFQALQMGGNAILGTDIDYSEAGAGKAMLLVCMAGTAVKITNLTELNYNIDALRELEEIVAIINEVELEMEKLSKFNSIIPYEVKA